MPAHIRIRILLAGAVAVISGSVFAVSEMQRRSEATSFAQYASVRELRNVGLTMVLALDAALAHGADASAEVETATSEAVAAIDRVRTRPDGAEPEEVELVERQAAATIRLTRLAEKAVAGRSLPRHEVRRATLLDRIVETNDQLLATLADERAEESATSARRPVFVVLALSLMFGLMHLALVERPARRERLDNATQREFGEAMQVARSEEEAYTMLARHVKRSAGARHVTVLNRNNSANRLEPATPVEPNSAAAAALEGARPDSCLAIRLARTHRVAGNANPLLSCEVCGKAAESTTCVPSLVGGEVVGAVLVDHRRRLEDRRHELIEESVAEAAPVIANLRNLAVAEIRAATDGLTGLPNQRAVHELIKRAAALAGRTSTSLALVLFDLDHFKTINDTYGHGKGDEVLAAIGAVAADTVRASDSAGRLGGEEFVVVLPATDRAGGIDLAEKLRSAIAAIEVPGVSLPVTASFGVAIMPDDAGEPALLLRQADRALYAAKNAGRNRVESARALPSPPDAELIA